MKKLMLFSILLCGCLPQGRLTGRVIDIAGPVPGAAVLGMVWVEDAAQVKPAPEVKNLSPEERDTVLNADMKTRGLPAAYAREFADKGGWFRLDRLHFSAETRNAVAAMKEPRITRVTVWAFQRGYRKHAVTTFLKDNAEEIPTATLLLSKPADWKELYRDNTADSLTRDYMVKGYSKEFGATEAEKDWILEYTHSNLWKAYVESDIKGDKELTELCGHDYSNIQVSASGIERKSEQERCAELKQRMGAIREIEDLWIAHANKSGDPLSAAKELVERAIAMLPAEVTEPKEYESMILAGLEDAANAQAKAGLRNGLTGQAWQDAAIAKYSTGDKAAAYRALGHDLYWQISKDVPAGTLTAQVSLNTIPGIKEKTAGFYLLMNRPLTAQLPNGDGGNHKDKPGYKVEASTDSGEKGMVIKKESERGRMERVPENGGEYLRFFDKAGRKTKELRLGTTEAKARLGKNKRFSASSFGLKISTDVETVLIGRAASGREVEVKRRFSKSAQVSKNDKFVVVRDSRADFVEYADALDSERFNDAVEIDGASAVYSLEGNEILKLDNYQGGVVVSNTGEYFIVANEKNGAIINRKKELLAELPVDYENAYFSDNDRFMILVERLSYGGFAVSVFDTKENKLELRKLSVADSVFKNFEEINISEDEREIVIPHFWDIKTRQIKTDKLRF